MPINRRDFLGSVGAVSLASALPIDESLSRAEQAPAGGAWDMSWVERLKGKYKAVFDSPGFGDGAALDRANLWIDGYKAVYGTAPSETSAVLVLRHMGVWLAMDDRFWRKYEIGKRYKFKDDKKQWRTSNPIANGADSGDATLAKFMGAGNIVLTCHVAFGRAVDIVSKEDKLNAEEAEKAARTYLIPGSILQPSGVFAALRAQEAGCRYILAS